MKSLVIISLLFISAFASQSVLKGKTDMPEAWAQSTSEVVKTDTLTLQIFVKQQNLDKLEETLYAVSDPRSEQYGQHLTNEEITQLVEPKAESLDTVFEWLLDNGVEDFELNANRDIITAEVPVQTVESMLSTTYQKFAHLENGYEIVRCLEYSVPAEVDEHIDFVGPTVRFPAYPGPKVLSNYTGIECTPKEIRALYNIGDFASTAEGNSVGFTGFLDEYYIPKDLTRFANKYDSELKDRKVTVVGKNGNKAGVEANLDMQYGMAISTGVSNTFFWSTTGDQPNNTGSEPFLKWMSDVSSATDVPHVFSISYADDEKTVDLPYAKRVGTEFQKAGARGISLLSASGDGGVEGTSAKFDMCQHFLSTFPAELPYITSVGGTTFKHPETAVDFSSGGFSNYFEAPSYQKEFIKTYKKNSASNLPDSKMYSATGAGVPDVSAQAQNCMVFNSVIELPVQGTSCASPVFAAMISLLNSIRLEAGKPVLGWLNPFLYQHPEVFNDIVKGNNPGCDTNGFYCAEGWDPVTGLGSLQFDKMTEVVKNLK